MPSHILMAFHTVHAVAHFLIPVPVQKFNTGMRKQTNIMRRRRCAQTEYMADEAEYAPVFLRRHTGAEFESGAVHRSRGVNEEAPPGVEVVDAHEEEDSRGGRLHGRPRQLSGLGRAVGRRRKLRTTPGDWVQEDRDPVEGRGRGVLP